MMHVAHLFGQGWLLCRYRLVEQGRGQVLLDHLLDLHHSRHFYNWG